MKKSCSGYSFKSTLLEAVDEGDLDSESKETLENEAVKTSASAYSFRSGQLDSVVEKEACDDLVFTSDNDHETDMVTKLNTGPEEYGNGDAHTNVWNAAGNGNGSVTLGNYTSDQADTSFTDSNSRQKENESELEEVSRKPRRTTFQRILGFRLLKGRTDSKYKTPLLNDVNALLNYRPKSSVISLEDEKDEIEGKLGNSEGEINGIPLQLPGTTGPGKKEPVQLDKDPVPRENQNGTDALQHVATRISKRISLSTSASELATRRATSSKAALDDAVFTDGKRMKQSTSSPVLHGSLPRDARDTRGRPMNGVGKMSSSDSEMKLSRLNQLASSARRRISVALGTVNQDKMSVASIKRLKQTRRTLKMFSCVVAVFAVCMLPNQITWIWVAFKGVHLNHVTTTIFYFLTYTNSVLNPWIYGAVNPTFRKAYRSLFMWKGKIELRPDRQNSGKISSLWLSRRGSEQRCADTRSGSSESKRSLVNLSQKASRR